MKLRTYFSPLILPLKYTGGFLFIFCFSDSARFNAEMAEAG